MFSTIDDKDMDKVKTIAENTLSGEKGGLIMPTIADRLRNEGIQQGMQQGMQQGVLLTLKESIELDLSLKFGDQGLKYMQQITKTFMI